MSTELTSICMPQIHDRPVHFLGVCLIFFAPHSDPFFPHSWISDRSNRRPILHGRLRSPKSQKGLFTQNPISLTDERPTDLYVDLIEISLSLSFYFILFVADRSPKNVDHSPQMEKRSGVSQRERVSTTSFSKPN